MGNLPAKTGVCLVRGFGVLALVLLAACPRSITDSGLVLTVSPPSANLFVSDSARFTAALRDRDGNPVSTTFSWTSDNTSIATVDDAGVVHAVGSGSTTIRVLAEGEATSAAVTVAPDNGQTLAIAPQSANVFVDETQQLTATLKDHNGNPIASTPDWSSNNPAVATVDGQGVVRGAAAGSATIQARVGNLVASAAIVVTARSGTAVLVGAGDIATCLGSGDEQTAALLDAIAGTVFAAGDNAYENGTAAEYENCYDPSWGRHKARTRPVPGNHEYSTLGASGYYGYFGSAAGDPAKGYYSYDIGAWHIIALNSNVAMNAGSPQEQWLRADLAAHPARCTLAYWHHPRFSSGPHGSLPGSEPLWRALYEAGAEVVISGHDHIYERFAPQTSTGELDNARGIRQFVVGTGGAPSYAIVAVAPHSEVRNTSSHGVLKLTLKVDRYDWQFVPVAGATFTDGGSASCH